jgi:hypothetical protein
LATLVAVVTRTIVSVVGSFDVVVMADDAADVVVTGAGRPSKKENHNGGYFTRHASPKKA